MTDIMIQYWQFALFGVIVAFAGILRFIFGVSEKNHKGIKFSIPEGMPHMKPIAIKTAGKGFFRVLNEKKGDKMSPFLTPFEHNC